MRVGFKNLDEQIYKYLMGGEMPAEEQAPVEQAPVEEAPTEDPLMLLAQAAMQALQNQDCNIAMQVCQAFVQMIQQAPAAQEEAPVEPTYQRKGGKLIRVR